MVTEARSITIDISSRICAAIEDAKRTRNWVATETGIPWTTFNRKLRAQSDFTVSELVRIAAVLERDFADLVPPTLTTRAA